MTLDYVLLTAIIGVPIGIILIRMVGVIELLYEISASLWMLPI